MKSECENDADEMTIKIFEAILSSDPKIRPYTPDALIRAFVYFAKKNDWTLEKILIEVEIGVKHCYEHMKM